MREDREQEMNPRTAVAQEVAQPKMDTAPQKPKAKSGEKWHLINKDGHYVNGFWYEWSSVQKIMLGLSPHRKPRQPTEPFGYPEITIEWLIERATKRPSHDVCGIYFLLAGGEVAYVGQSKNCMARISVHCGGPISFDSFHFMPFPEENLNKAERHYIRLFNPSFNVDVKTKADRAAFDVTSSSPPALPRSNR